MGKKTPQQEADIAIINEARGTDAKFAALGWGPFLEWNQDKADEKTSRTFSDWLSWKANEITRPKFQPPIYEAKEFEQLPVAPQTNVPSDTGTPTNQAPIARAQVINRYLEQVMSNLNSPTSGQTEVGKALRAKSSGGESNG